MDQVAEVAEEVIAQDLQADTVILHLIAKVDVATVEVHTHQDSVLHMANHATTVVNRIISQGTAEPDVDLPHQVTGHKETCMTWNQQKNLNMTLFKLFVK